MRTRVAGSFRDPSGFLFYRDGQLYRQVNVIYRTHYDQFLSSGLYQRLVDAGLLIPHREVEIEAAEPDGAYKIIQPERVPFVSYPYEWCFSQWKDAALTTLEIEKKALEHGLSLKDCSAYNVQFRRAKPVFIDTLSFETYREGEPWVAYRQFCQHFLAPLALMSYRDVRFGQLFRIHIDGLPLDLVSQSLPARTWLNFGLLSHIHLHARSQRHFAARSVDVSGRRVSRMAFLGLIDSLERAITRLTWQPEGTEWVGYRDDASHYSTAALEHKEALVSQFLDRTGAERVWDLGANVGAFSRVAAGKGMLTISADVDPACVEVNYLRGREEGERCVLPLLLDLTNPSPGLGWAHEERLSLVERGPADAVLALALLHHLAISNNLPFDKIAEFFSLICRWLIVEFVPKEDSQAQRLLSSREDIFANYNRASFEKAFGACFYIRDSVAIRDTGRVLCLMEKRSG